MLWGKVKRVQWNKWTKKKFCKITDVSNLLLIAFKKCYFLLTMKASTNDFSAVPSHFTVSRKTSFFKRFVYHILVLITLSHAR